MLLITSSPTVIHLHLIFFIFIHGTLYISHLSSTNSSINGSTKLRDSHEQLLSKQNKSGITSGIPTRSSFRLAAKHQDQSTTLNIEPRKEEKHLFRIGLIVPRTAFLSQYKTYTQRIKDTFSHLLQLSRHQHQNNLSTLHSPSAQGKTGGSSSSGMSSISSSQQTFDSKPSTSSCLSNTSPLIQHHKRLSWPNLTFNQYFDIKVVDLVSLAPRSSAQVIIESMCRKLIEQNVSVIVYLENNQDQTVTSLDSQSSIQLSSSLHSDDNKLVPDSQLDSKKPHGFNISKQVQSSEEFSGKQSALQLRASNGIQQVSSQAHFIMHLAHSAGIPMIAWSMTATSAQRPKKQRTLHLAPTVAHEAEAMLSIMERYSWYSFSIVTTTLAGHDDFILALMQFMATSNSGPAPAAGSKKSTSFSFSKSPANLSSTPAHPVPGNTVNINGASKNFKLLDVITIRKRTLIHIEEEIRQLTVSESRVVLLYATKGEAIDILKVAKKLKLTKRSYAWIVAQSVIGPNENERAPLEFHPGLLGIYFRSNHERLLDELSRAITIIAHGLEGFLRDKDTIISNKEFILLNNSYSEKAEESKEMIDDALAESRNAQENFKSGGGVKYNNHRKQNVNNNATNINYESHMDKAFNSDNYSPMMNQNPRRYTSNSAKIYSMTEYLQKLQTVFDLTPSDEFSEERGDLLYEYFRKSSPSNVFDADGSLKDVELNVVNLDNEHQWRRIGCFSETKLTIDDITWPEQAERPPSGTMEKFHLRAVFLEEPSFVNLADPDTETGECKANRAVRCRYKTARLPRTDDSIHVAETLNESAQKHLSATNRSHISSKQDKHAQNLTSYSTSSSDTNEFEYKCCSGFCIDLMEKFATDLKFSYDLYRVPDGFWGIFENNTWNGLIGEITKGRADVIVSSTKINSDRQKAVDFTVPFLDTGISILVGKQTGVISKLAFLEPFDTLAWIMFICVGIPLATTSIFYFEWLSPNGFYASDNQRIKSCRKAASGDSTSSNWCNERCDQSLTVTRITREHHKFSFCRTLWLVITILFGSAAHIDSPKGYTARFMSNVWATFAVVFLAVYTANLAAFMITREEYLELSGIGDSKLAYPYYRHPPLKFGTITGGNTHSVLSANKPNLYNYMRRFNRPTVEDGVDAVKSGQLDAFVYDALVLDFLASQDPECKLVNVGSWYSMTGYALAFSRKSRYYEKFNMKMLEYRKNGELDRLRRFWLQGLCKPGQNRHSISKPLDLSQFMSAFLLLGAGIICSVFILVLEHLYIIYVRDRLIKSRHRKKLIKCLYPFSLSLTDTLRLPGDDEQDNEQSDKHGAGNKLIVSKYNRTWKNFMEDGKLSTVLEMNSLDNERETRLVRRTDMQFERQRFQLSKTNLETSESDTFVYRHHSDPRDFNKIRSTSLSSLELQLLENMKFYEDMIEIVDKRTLMLFGGHRDRAHNINNELKRVKSLICQLRRTFQDLSMVKDLKFLNVALLESKSSQLRKPSLVSIYHKINELDSVTNNNLNDTCYHLDVGSGSRYFELFSNDRPTQDQLTCSRVQHSSWRPNFQLKRYSTTPNLQKTLNRAVKPRLCYSEERLMLSSQEVLLSIIKRDEDMV